MPDPVRYVGSVTVARWCGVSRSAVTKWLGRCVGLPAPDVYIGSTPGWLPARETEIRRWMEARRG